MNHNEPCNCDQALELWEALDNLVAEVNKHKDIDKNAIIDARKVLEKGAGVMGPIALDLVFDGIVGSLEALPVLIDNGGVESHASITARSRRIVTRNSLRYYVELSWRGNCGVGENKRLTIETMPPSSQEDIARLTAACSRFLDGFAEAMGDDFGFMTKLSSERRQLRREALHLRTGFWKVLGLLCARYINPRESSLGTIADSVNAVASQVALVTKTVPLEFFTQGPRRRFDKAAHCKLLFEHIVSIVGEHDERG